MDNNEFSGPSLGAPTPMPRGGAGGNTNALPTIRPPTGNPAMGAPGPNASNRSPAAPTPMPRGGRGPLQTGGGDPMPPMTNKLEPIGGPAKPMPRGGRGPAPAPAGGGGGGGGDTIEGTPGVSSGGMNGDPGPIVGRGGRGGRGPHQIGGPMPPVGDPRRPNPDIGAPGPETNRLPEIYPMAQDALRGGGLKAALPFTAPGFARGGYVKKKC